MFRVTCNQCGASTVTPDGNSDALTCSCCLEQHSHEATANGCPGAGLNHTGADCPVPLDCLVVNGSDEVCPGGHCHVSLADCTVCRPCTIEWLGVVQTTVPMVIQA